MKKRTAFGITTVVIALLGLVACTGSAPSKPKVEVDKAKLAVFQTLPAEMDAASNPITDEKVALGRMLYYDPRLSKSQDISCNTCHDLNKYGAEREPVSTGIKGQKGARNAPTVYNAAGHIAQFWD